MKRVFCLFSILTLCVFLLSGCGEPDVKDTLGSVYDIVSSDVVSSENSSTEEASSDNSSEVSSEESSSSENNSSVVSSDVSSDNSSSDVSSSESSSEVESSEPENEENVSSDNSSETNEPPPPPPAPVKKECYLTFDDGPTKNTLEILEILDRYDVRATFFVIAQNGEYMKKIVDGGHAIGLHSYTHNYNIYRSSEAYFDDLGKISDYVYNAVGQRPDIIRFAGGSSNTISMSYCSGIMSKLTKEVREKGYNYYDWNVGSGDANAGSVPAATIASNVINGAKNKNSICVLMHDAAGKKTTVDALPSIIEGLKQQGFEFKVLTSDIQGFKHAVNN